GGLVEPQRIALDQQSGQRASAAAFVGSQVRFEVTLNKPVPVTGLTVASLAAGLPAATNNHFADNAQASEESDRITFDFRLDQTLATRIDLVDKHNLASISERVYRIEAIEDKAPAVSIITPSADESVLASAVIPLEAMAQDDVGIDDLALRAELPLQGEDQPAEGEPARTVVELAKVDDRLARLSASDELDLSHYQLSVGQTVELHAR